MARMVLRKAKRCSRDHNKIIFKDELSAKIALAKQRDNNDRVAVPRRAYQCAYAKHYHVTSNPVVREENGKVKASARRQNPENAARIGRVAAASWKATDKVEGTQGNGTDREGSGS